MSSSYPDERGDQLFAVGGVPPGLHEIVASHTVPPGLTLLQSQWFIRHGERTPVRMRFPHLIPTSWNYCNAGRKFWAAVLDLTPSDNALPPVHGTPVWRNKLEIQRLSSENAKDNECATGELTDVGRLSTLRVGQQIRKLYVDKLGFLQGTLDDHDSVKFRSTPMARTIESCQQVMHGLYPADNLKVAPKLVVRDPLVESLYPNTLCAAMNKIDKSFAKEAAKKWDPTLEPLDAKWEKLLGVKIRVDSHPSANGLLDTVAACVAHDIKLPKQLQDPTDLKILEKAIVHEWFDAYASKEFTQLSQGRAFNDMINLMKSRISGRSNQKLGVNTCHDTSLAGMLNALGAFNDQWPPFTSHLSFELFKSSSQGWTSFFKPREADHYVRLRFNGKNWPIPKCAAPGKHLEGHPDVCTFSAFQEALKEVLIDDAEWSKRCSIK